MKLRLTLFALAIGGSFSTLALADVVPDPLKGFEVMLRPGFGGGGSDSPVQLQNASTPVIGDPGALLKGESPYGGGFAAQAFIGYRVHPLFSLGVRGGIRFSSAKDLTDGSTDLSRSAWDAGFYARAYPLALVDSLMAQFDPWVSIGVEYMQDNQTSKRDLKTSSGSTINGNVDLRHYAVAIPIGIGLDYRLEKHFSIGPSFEYAIAVPVAGCAETSASGYVGSNYCTNSDPGKSFLKANTYSVWTLGLNLRLTL